MNAIPSSRRGALLLDLRFYLPIALALGLSMNALGHLLCLAYFRYWWQVATCYWGYVVPVALLLRRRSTVDQLVWGTASMIPLELAGYGLGTSLPCPGNAIEAVLGVRNFSLAMVVICGVLPWVLNGLVGWIAGLSTSRKGIGMNIAVEGANLYYTTRGEGPVCLVLCGFGTGSVERLMPAALSDRWRLVFVDLRASGRSSGMASDLTFDRLAEDLDAVRKELGVDRVAVLGHSILGVLAIEYGRRRPESVSHVIAVGTPPNGDMNSLMARSAAFFEEDASEERKRIWEENRARLVPGKPFVEVLVAQTPQRFFDPLFDTAPLFADAIWRPELIQQVIGKLTPTWDVTVGAGDLNVPIYLALGRYDYTVPYTFWDGLAERIPNLTVGLFERSGHQAFFEEPERFVEAVGEWMASTR